MVFIVFVGCGCVNSRFSSVSLGLSFCPEGTTR